MFVRTRKKNSVSHCAVDSARRVFGFSAKVRSQPKPSYAGGNVRSDLRRRLKAIYTAMLIERAQLGRPED